MNTTHRLAVGAVALAAALTPVAALASTHAPAPAPSHSASHHATHRDRSAKATRVRDHRGRRGTTHSTSTNTAPSAAPAAPGMKVSPGTLAYDRDENLLQAQVSMSGWEAGIPAWVKCMNAAGLPTVATSTGPTAGGWTFVTGTTPRARFLDSAAGESASSQIQADCMVKAYHLHG